MSGPKVVRIVSIEQLREEARVQLAQAADSIRLWQEAAAGLSEATSARLSRLMEEQNKIEASIQSGRFADVTKRSQAIVAAVRQDIQRFHEEHDARNARARVQQHSLRRTARSVLERSRSGGQAISRDERDRLEAAANGKAFDVQEVATIAARWLGESSESAQRAKSHAEVALARSLSGSSGESSAAELLRRLEAEFADPRINAAEKQVAELTRLGEQQAAEDFEQRLLMMVSGEPGTGASTRGLAFDALGLELSRAVKLARARAELLAELATEIAAATATNDLKACEQAVSEAKRALETRDLEEGRAQIARIREVRETCQRTRAASAARKSILSGLKKLGYEVREELLTTWAEKKRVAVRHPDRPGVAVELAGTGDSGRVQTRMVAVEGASRDSRSDKQVEEEWCGSLATLQAAVAREGGTILIEKAVAAGIQPLKVIPDEWQDAATAIQKPRERDRI